MPKIISSKDKGPPDSENSCKLDYPADDGMQTFSSTSFNLNDKGENSNENLENKDFKTNMEEDIDHTDEEDFEKKDMETELEEIIDATDQEDVTVCQSTSLTQTSTCFSNRSDLSDSKVLESNHIECKYTEQCHLLESGLSEMNDIEMKSIEEQEMLINRETKQNQQNEKLENQNNDIENPKNCEEASSDALQIKKYGIKKCFVSLKRDKPFTIHYGRDFFKIIARDAYKSFQNPDVINFDKLYRESGISKYSSLTKETFQQQIKKHINLFNLRKEFLGQRLEAIKKYEAQMKGKDKEKEKILYENDFIFVDKKDIQKVLAALQNVKFAFVKLELNKAAEKAKKIMEELAKPKSP